MYIYIYLFRHDQAVQALAKPKGHPAVMGSARHKPGKARSRMSQDEPGDWVIFDGCSMVQ